jgi:hypothetical protein
MKQNRKKEKDGYVPGLCTYYTNFIILEFTPSIYKKKIYSQVLVAHACNPSYSRGRDQEDHSSKPAEANRL